MGAFTRTLSSECQPLLRKTLEYDAAPLSNKRPAEVNPLRRAAMLFSVLPRRYITSVGTSSVQVLPGRAFSNCRFHITICNGPGQIGEFVDFRKANQGPETLLGELTLDTGLVLWLARGWRKHPERQANSRVPYGPPGIASFFLEGGQLICQETCGRISLLKLLPRLSTLITLDDPAVGEMLRITESILPARGDVHH